MSQPDVTEFLVIAPLSGPKSRLTSRGQFEAYMAREFPGYRFRLIPPGDGPADQRDFTVVPLMGASVPGKPDVIAICERPSHALLLAVRQAANAFTSRPIRLH